jgi:hypothetical protein
MAILGAEYLLKMLPKGTHTYAQFIRPPNWRAGYELQVLSCWISPVCNFIPSPGNARWVRMWM